MTAGCGHTAYRMAADAQAVERCPSSGKSWTRRPTVRPPKHRRRRNQRRVLSAAENRAIERRAVAVVREHFAGLGFTTEDVGATESYDIRATLGKRVVLIEVKGTTGAGESITLTANEVALHTAARDNALAIVRHIELGQVGGTAVATGGELVLTMPWVPDPAALRPIAYTYDTGIAGQ